VKAVHEPPLQKTYRADRGEALTKKQRVVHEEAPTNNVLSIWQKSNFLTVVVVLYLIVRLCETVNPCFVKATQGRDRSLGHH